MKRILIIEDDKTIVEGLEAAFTFHGFSLLSADNGADGIYLLGSEKPDVVILDVMLPGVDGYEICKRIRMRDRQIPIIMLTAKGREDDKLKGFETGADDYLTKPFSARELIARVNALLKRSGIPVADKQVVRIGEVTVNFTNFTVNKGGRETSLSLKEYEILKLLVDNPDVVISRHRIIDDIWGEDYYPNPKTIDNFILKLRNKVEKDPKNPRHILAVHGVGYKFKA
ncbi:MAG: response regulator transcription factor [bacterium]|nr:response regulator transcription factor [bacterium]